MATEMKDPGEGFSTAPATKTQTGMIAVAQQREIAEVQSKMILARANPRDEKAAVDRILQACTRQALAESALYNYARGGTEISGPSIRLAEVLAQNWGNIDFGIRELEQRDGESTVEAYAWDLQTNVCQRKIFQVPHIRYSKSKGNVLLADPRDIYERVANDGARRLRACILGVIPGDVQEVAVKQCETTLKTKAEVTPERLKSLVEKFSEYKVTKEMIERRIQRHLEAMTPALLVQLGKIYNSLKDGMSTIDEWFGGESAGPERAKIDLATMKPAAEQNRGHGDENLKATKPDAMTQAKEKIQEKAKAKAVKPPDNPNYSDTEPEPLFGREPGIEG